MFFTEPDLLTPLHKASFIGLTGTPIESGDKCTQAVFGDYIDVYDIRRYQNRTIEAAQVIAELIELAKQMREGQKRGKELD